MSRSGADAGPSTQTNTTIVENEDSYYAPPWIALGLGFGGLIVAALAGYVGLRVYVVTSGLMSQH